MNKNIYLLTVIGFMSSSSAFAQQNIGDFLAKNPEIGSLCNEYKKEQKTKRDSSRTNHNASSSGVGFGYKGFGFNGEGSSESNFSGSYSNEDINFSYEKDCDNVLAYLREQGQMDYDREMKKIDIDARIEEKKIDTGARIEEQKAVMRERMEKYKVDADRENNKYRHNETKESISSNERINLYKIQTDYSSTNNTNATNYLMMDRQLQTEELKDVRRESVIRDLNKQDAIRDDLKKQRKY